MGTTVVHTCCIYFSYNAYNKQRQYQEEVNKNMCNERRLQGNVTYFATFQITDFSKAFILFEFGRPSANARDVAAAAVDTLCGPDSAAQHTESSYDLAFMAVLVALCTPLPLNPWIEQEACWKRQCLKRLWVMWLPGEPSPPIHHEKKQIDSVL